MAIPVLPESAPFTTEQRAWLNGFLAGVLSIDAVPNTSSAVAPPVLNGHNGHNGNGHALEAAAPEAEDDFPWHDPNLPIDERLQLAEGKPKERVLMAAMAQLDCGQCGYLCKTYAEAIARGEEKSLLKCTPGGKETSKKLKEIVAKEIVAQA